MTVTPDIAGFRDAQDRLRAELGQDITFHVPTPKVYDPGVALDPETGEPYDPATVPTSGGGHADVTIRVSVVNRPLRRNTDDQIASGAPIGPMSEGNAALLVAPADYPSVQYADEFVLNGNAYHITEVLPDGLGGITRYIFYGQIR